MSNRVLHLFIGVVVATLVGCSGDPSIISRFGEHEMRGTDDRLLISRKKSLISKKMSLISIQVLNKEDSSTQVLNEGASVYSRWFLFWDHDTTSLWYYSGDRGVFLYVRSSDGNYSETIIYPDTPVPNAPPEFFNRLPQSIKSMINKNLVDDGGKKIGADSN